MKRVLIAEEKHGTRIFDISTEKLKAKAYLSLFLERDKEGYYEDIDSIVFYMHQKAKSGDCSNAMKFLRFRSNHEYERVYEQDVE